MTQKKILVVAMMVLGVVSASATALNTANGTVDCKSYTVHFEGDVIAAAVGDKFELRYSIQKWPSGETIAGEKITLLESASAIYQTVDFSITRNGSIGPLVGDFTFTGRWDILRNGVVDLGDPFTVAAVSCPAEGGCPGTPGYWKNVAKHPFPSSVQSGGLTIGGVHYSATDLLTILNSNGSGAISNLGRQLVAALLNKAAGATVNPTAEAAITSAQALLSANQLNLLTSVVSPSTPLGQALTTQAAVLAAYNNANFGTCTEGSGLQLGGQ